MLLLLINHGLGEHGLDHIINEFVWLVVGSVGVLEVKAYITGPLMSEFKRVLTLLLESSEDQKSFMRFLNVLIVISNVGGRYINTFGVVNLYIYIR